MSRVDEARRRVAALTSNDAADGTRRRVALDSLPLLDTSRQTIKAFPTERMAQAVLNHRSPSLVQHRPLSPPWDMDSAPQKAYLPAATGLELTSPDRPPSSKLLGHPDVTQAFQEQYRLLAAALHNAQLARKITAIMIASAVGGEGKTLTAANLALTLSDSYQRRVLLLDADLRCPSLHALFNTSNSPGLTDALADTENRALQTRQITSTLAFLPAGSSHSSPMAALTSDEMRRLLRLACQDFAWVIIDTPPVALLPDASLIASMVDGAVIVVRAGSTALELVERAVTAIGRDKALGFVLNAANHGHRTHDYHYRPSSLPSVSDKVREVR